MQDFTFMLDKGMKELSDKGAFLTVKNAEGPNTMTISWGFVGFMWRKPHFITVVRPQRYTYEKLEKAANSFTVSVPFEGKLKDELNICGTKSGRDINKADVVKFKPARLVDSPIVDGCALYYECKIDMAQPLDGSLMLPEIAKSIYPENDFHVMYFGEIVECYGA